MNLPPSTSPPIGQLLDNKLSNSLLLTGNKGIGKKYFISQLFEEYIKKRVESEQTHHHLSLIKNNSNIDYLTADLCSNAVMVKMDLTEINYPDESFDMIICNHVLEHIIDDRKAMDELYRILNPGGCAILQVPISLSLDKTYEDSSVTTPSEREKIFGQSDHVRIYAIDYLDRLKESGFQVTSFKWWNDEEFSSLNNKFGLLQHENVFLVAKLA